MSSKAMYTITEVCRITGLTRPVIYKAIEAGTLEVWRPWPGGNPRIHHDQLEAWMGKSTRVAGETNAA